MSETLTRHWAGYLSLLVLVVSYLFVVTEERTHFRKSKPVLAGAGIIWLLIAIASSHDPARLAEVDEAFKENLLDYAQILLFLVVAVTYINVLQERLVFDALRYRLVHGGWTLRRLFWLTGGLAFALSPVADNMTTALIMGAVVLAVGGGDARFVAASFASVVVAANASGAFSPFGDITTLMVWQAGEVRFGTFFHLIPAALVTWLVPAVWMSFGVPNTRPVIQDANEAPVRMKRGALIIIALFATTITAAVIGHNEFHLPPVYGMLFIGLPLLKIYGYLLKIRAVEQDAPFDVMHHIQHIEWDTMLFFAGIIMAVGGIGHIGYLAMASEALYSGQPEIVITLANTAVGLASAVIDNIPIMFAVLHIGPEMSQWQWLLVTLTAGVGGSLLSIGSAAGVALMGASKGLYTFNAHFAHTPKIAVGYFAAIAAHWVYAMLFAPHLF